MTKSPEERAIEKALSLATVATWVPELDLYVVASDSNPGVMYQVSVHWTDDEAILDRATRIVGGAREANQAIQLHCSCPAGQHRESLVPCYHAAAVALKIQRDGLPS